MNRKLLCICNL